MVFEPIILQRTAQAVVERFKSLILDGVLRPGDRLPAERQLAVDLDVSRPILRDALAILEADGLVATRQGEGTFVADLIGQVFSDPVSRIMRASSKGLADYMEFRLLMEADMAGLAAQRATPADLDMLASLRQAMLDADAVDDDGRLEAQLDVELHTLVVEAAHNIVYLHVLRACYRLLADDVFSNRTRLYRLPGERGILLTQHLALIDAILAGDEKAARKAAQEHIEHVSAATRHLGDVEARETTSRLRRTIRLANTG